MASEALTAAQHVVERFRWVDGDADTWSMLVDPQSLAAIVQALADLLRDDRVDVVVGIESRGFVITPAVAVAIGAGFTPVRKGGALFPGPTDTELTAPDYRGRSHTLAVRTDHLLPRTRVALVDDWIETGSQAAAAQQLVTRAGAELVAVVVIVDEATPAARDALPPIRSLITASALPDG